MTVEKSDEFDEHMLNRQNFSYQNIAFRKFRYYIFYGYNTNLSLSGFVTLCRGMESWSTFIPLPIRRTLLKTRIHLKEKSGPIYLGHTYLSKVIPSSSWSIASCNADITKVLKQVKRSFTKNCYTKLIPAQRYEIYKFLTLASTL